VNFWLGNSGLTFQKIEILVFDSLIAPNMAA